MKDLDLNDVRTFVAVAQVGTLTAAAKELQLPTSTVSRSLTRLEQHLGVLLVQRSPRGLVLTDSGKEYLQSCRGALRALKDGSELLEGHRSSPSGLIKVACPITMARDVLAPLMKEFLGTYPKLRIEIEPYAASWDQEPRDDVDVFFKLLAPKGSLWIGNGIQNLVAGIVLLPAAFTLSSVGDIVPSARLLGAFAFLVLGGAILAYRLWFHLLRVCGATAASAYHFLMPPLGMLFAWMILGEHVEVRDLMGIVPVALGIYLVTRPAAAAAPALR